MKKKTNKREEELLRLKKENIRLIEENEEKRIITRNILIFLETMLNLFLVVSILLNWANYEIIGRIRFELIIPLFVLSLIMKSINQFIEIYKE